MADHASLKEVLLRLNENQIALSAAIAVIAKHLEKDASDEAVETINLYLLMLGHRGQPTGAKRLAEPLDSPA